MLADVRHALRGLLHRPGFTIVALATLALVIGATTAIFSVVDGVLLRATPVADLDRVVMIWETDRHSGTTREPGSVPDFLDYQRDSRTLSAVEGVIGAEVNFAPPQGDPARLAALAVSHGLLPMLGISPVAGRTFTADEDRARGPKVALISESLWTRSFGRAAEAIGGSIRLDEETYTVVGVMPDRADFGMLQILGAADYSRGYADRGDRATADVWLPLQPDVESLPRSTHPLLMLGRLTPQASVASAQDEFTRLSSGLERAYRENSARGVFVEPLDDVVFGPARPALLLLWVAVAFVLLIGCVNVANLLLVHGRGRAREVAVRLALGASVSRLARQFLLENLVLTLGGATIGVALAALSLRMLLTLAPPSVPRLGEVGLDVRVLSLTLGLAVLSGIVFGLVPLLQAWRLDPQATLKSEGLHGASTGRAGRRTQRVLVVAELAIAAMLAVGATLLVRSFSHVLNVDAGFHTTGVVKAEYQLPATRYPFDFSKWPNLVEIHAFTNRLVQRAGQLPGVDAVAVSGAHPLDPGFTNSFQVVGREAESADWPELSIRSVTPGYFRVTGLGLTRGRLLREADTSNGPKVLVINEAAAARFFEGREPIGAQIRFWGVTWSIVGVVANEKFQGLTEPDPIAAYAPLAQAPTRGTGVLLVRAAGDPAVLMPAIGSIVREIDPALAVYGVEPLDDTLLRSVGQRRFAMILLVLFAGLALLLSIIGVHGVLSYGVTERRRELGIRVALGARSRQITWLVVGEGLGLAAAGLTLGLAGALGATRALSSMLFGIAATDVGTYAMVAGALALAAISATLIPARRAARVDPAQLLRD